MLLEVVESIEKNPGRTGRIAVRLNQKQLNSLNAKQPIYIDFTDDKMFGANKKDIRIANVEFSNLAVEPIDGDFTTATIDLTATHNGKCYIESQQKNYLFQLDQGKGTTIHWTTQYDVIQNMTSDSRASDTDKSILSYILDDNRNQQVFFAYPGALTQLKVTSHAYGDTEAKLEDATIIINYEYREF
ncbi:MAG: hypothetical protein Fur0010_25550 [Bdellovibrio sp.]